ncbi:energy transducer TonB [Aliikangiella maris]|uniref:Protein TonB n=2 Tax=Aliikangiella maris TaxID=3162458 RepID=A0ABV3MNI9_9GAMM
MARFLNASIFAFLITAALFWGMQSLITGSKSVLTDPVKGKVLDFVRLKPDETVQKKQRKPKKPPKPEEPPPDINQPPAQMNNLANTQNTIGFSADLDVDTGLEGGLALGSGDGEYLPIVKVAPIYPRRALSRGIEGYVIVEFTVTKQGSVRDPVVVEAEPEGIFNQAAVEAAKKFKYKPRVIDGVASEVAGVQNKITFKLDQ